MSPIAPRAVRTATAAALLAALSVLAGASGDAAPDEAARGTVAAVARLNHAGYRRRMHCTASLIGPREVVTARHCVEGLDPAELHVLLGFDRGAFAHHGRAASVSASEAHDIAQVCLEEAPPFEPLAAARDGPAGAGPAAVRGYPASRAQAQSVLECGLTPMAGRPEALLDCALEHGVSGAPVTMGSGEDARVVAVVSASGEGRSLVVTLDALPLGGCEDG